MDGKWLAGFMNPQPRPITIRTIATFVITMMPFTNADSAVPRTRINESTSRMATAGMFMMPCVPVPAIVSSGEWLHSYGTGLIWMMRSRLFIYWLHAIATVAAPTAYSSTRSQPMIQATSSPIVVYEYVYALPAIGII